MLKYLCCFLIIGVCGFSELSTESLRALHNSIDPTSISKQLTFYHLYPETLEGKKALQTANELLNKHRPKTVAIDLTFTFPEIDILPLIYMVNRFDAFDYEISEEQIKNIQYLASHLKNRDLKGHELWEKKDLYSLATNQVDLARSILIYQFGSDRKKILEYESVIDLITLQILAKLPKNANDVEKIKAINHFIFHEMGFRFPPHSLWAKDIDVYTFLPSVLDSRQGVCLGVSILYLCIAQRIDLPLDIITPQGHIYISYSKDDKRINIETTARGIHIDTDEYLGINAHHLIHRNMKEVIGLNFINQASVLLHKRKYEEAIELYEEAKIYLVDTHLVNKLLAFTLFLNGEKEKALPLLKLEQKSPDPSFLSIDPMVEDLLSEKIDRSSLEAIFSEVDETQQSILEKQKELKQACRENPQSFDTWFHLGITYLQLSRTKEAFEVFKTCDELYKDQPQILYYLTFLAIERDQYPLANSYFKRFEKTIVNHKKKKQILHPIELEIMKYFRENQGIS